MEQFGKSSLCPLKILHCADRRRLLKVTSSLDNLVHNVVEVKNDVII